MKTVFSPEFKKNLKRYHNIKKIIERKIEQLKTNPLGLAEPLKYDLQGLNSCTVKRSYLIVYAYCRECRSKQNEQINNCRPCKTLPDDTLIFLTVAPHDYAYKIDKSKIIESLSSDID